jgi:hypothetical protein
MKHGKPSPKARYVAKRVPLDVQSFSGNHVGEHSFDFHGTWIKNSHFSGEYVTILCQLLYLCIHNIV